VGACKQDEDLVCREEADFDGEDRGKKDEIS
jgi:hypothetical protein